MNQTQRVPLKAFWQQLKALVKPNYTRAMWPIGGFFLLYLGLTAILGYLNMSLVAAIPMNIMMMMYGMASGAGLLVAIGELIGLFALILVVGFGYSFIATAICYAYQDQLRDPKRPVGAGSIWQTFRHLRKNQLWRLLLYTGLFMFLWGLPLDVVSALVAKNTVLVIICRVANYLLLAWKGYEYSQAYFLYREKQPAFLGQSMRAALTASRRYMGGLKLNLFGLQLVIIFLPVAIWAALFTGIGYYGLYTATYFWSWLGLVVGVLGVTAYLPVLFATSALFYELTRTQPQTQLDADFNGVFVPVDQLTGEAYRLAPATAPVAKPAKPKKTVKKGKATKEPTKPQKPTKSQNPAPKD